MPAPTLIHVLILEDAAAGAELMVAELRHAGFAPDWRRVETEAEYVDLLGPWVDVVLADDTRPSFDVVRALHILKARDLDIPFIVVSGTSGEEVAVACMKEGASDYVFKDRLARLGPAVAQVLDQRRAREAKRTTEIALREGETRLRMVFEQAAVGLGITAPTGRWLRVNQRLCDMVGYTAEEMLTRRFQDMTHPDDLGLNLILHRELFEYGRSSYSLEKRYIHKSGAPVWVNLTISVVRDAAGDPTYSIAIVQDITVEKQLEQDLLHAQRLEGVGRLAGGIAHDFNNLLTVIRGRCDIALAKLRADASLHRELELIRNTADRAAALTRQLLAFSRKQILQPRVVDLNGLVRDSTNFLRQLIGEDIELVPVPAADLGRVRVDPGQLEQVIVNLAVNARDAMPAGGRLTIETSNAVLDPSDAVRPADVTPGRYVMLAVSDTGVGMDSTTRERMFEPFFTTKDSGKGTGLGLATVERIVKQSGGHIRVDSEPGAGTRFRIYLPRTDAVADTEPPADATLPYGTETVLLVEDDEAVRSLTREVLEGLGYTVLEATSGGAAILIAERYRGLIHVLLTDVVMPRTSGRALAQAIGVTRPETRTLFMSGYPDDAIVRHGGLEAGISFLAKPFTVHALAVKVREVLDRHP